MMSNKLSIFLFLGTFLLYGFNIENIALIAFEPMLPFFIVVFILSSGFFNSSRYLDNTFLNYIIRSITKRSNIYLLEMVLYLTHLRKIAFLVKELETVILSNYFFDSLKNTTDDAFDNSYKKYIIHDFFNRAVEKSIYITQKESNTTGIRELITVRTGNPYFIRNEDKTIETIAFELSVTGTSINQIITPKEEFTIDPHFPGGIEYVTSPIQMRTLIYLFNILRRDNKHLNGFEKCPEGEYVITKIANQPPYYYNGVRDIFLQPDHIQMAMGNMISKLEHYTEEELAILNYFNVDLNSQTCEIIKDAAKSRSILPIDNQMTCNEDNGIDHVAPLVSDDSNDNL